MTIIKRELYTIDIKRPWHKVKGPFYMYVIMDSNNKYVWAEDINTKKRGIIGTSAFYTLASASAARMGRLAKFEHNRYVKWKYPDLYRFAMQQLKV